MQIECMQDFPEADKAPPFPDFLEWLKAVPTMANEKMAFGSGSSDRDVHSLIHSSPTFPSDSQEQLSDVHPKEGTERMLLIAW